MGRWTQYDEDSYRLPEGFTRIGYDADTSQYTYRDAQGTIYRGAPRAEYGTLTPVTSSHPEMDNKTNETRPKVSVETTGPAPTSFHDILPAYCITTPSSSDSSPSSPSNIQTLGSSTRAQFIGAVRKTALPKMQGVVQNLRRSMTHKNVSSQQMDDDGDKLLRRSSLEKTSLSRSDSSATSHSNVSETTLTPTLVDASPQRGGSKVG